MMKINGREVEERECGDVYAKLAEGHVWRGHAQDRRSGVKQRGNRGVCKGCVPRMRPVC